MTLEELLIKIGVDTADAEEKVETFGAKMKNVGDSISKLSTTSLLVGGAITGALGLAVKAAAQEESTQSKLNMVLKNTKQYSAEASKSIIDLANSIQSKTGIDNTALEDGARMIVQFGATTDQAKKLMPVLADLASTMRTDVTTAGQKMGVIFEGNYNALKKQGIDLTDYSKKLKDLQGVIDGNSKELDTLTQKYDNGKISADEYATQSEALKTKIGDLQKQLEDLQSPASIANEIIKNSTSIQGMAEEQAKTLSGQMAIMKTEFEDFGKKIGGVLIPIIKDLIDKYLKPLLEHLSNMNPTVLENTVKIAALAGGILVAVGTVGKMVVGIGNVISTIGALGKAIKALMSADFITNLFSPTGLIIMGIAAVVAGIILIIKHWEEIKKAFNKFYEGYIKPWLDPLLDGLKRVVDFFKEIFGWIGKTWDKVEKALGLQKGGGVDLNAQFAGGFAEGGSFTVSRPTMFMAGEAGTERVTVTPQSKEDNQVFYEMLKELRKFNNETAPLLGRQISLSVSGLGGKI